MKKIRVAVIHSIPSPARIALFNEIEKIKKLDLTVYFLQETSEGVDWINRTKFDFKVPKGLSFRFFTKESYRFSINPSVVSELAATDHDVVVAFGWDSFASIFAFLFCSLTSRRFILWSGSTAYEQSWRRTFFLPLVKLVVHGSRAYIAYGSWAKEYLVSLGANPNKVFIAYNTVNTDFFKREEDRWRKKKVGLKNELGLKTSKVILYLGQVIERKGIRNLIEAFAKIKNGDRDVSLLIVGSGEQLPELKDLVKRREIHDVFFHPAVKNSETPRFYALADVFVLPSKEEVWGLVLNEAMASRLPVITTSKVGAAPDLIEDGKNGFVVEPENPAHLSKAINDALRRSKEMGSYSQKKIEGFSLRKASEGVSQAIGFVMS